VVVSGWKVYNNKGKVGEEYEPYFDKGYTYKTAKTHVLQLQKMQIRYDAGGRHTETTFPDGSKSLVVYGIPENMSSPPLSSAVSSSSPALAGHIESRSTAFPPPPGSASPTTKTI